jgi:hypothetical protein
MVSFGDCDCHFAILTARLDVNRYGLRPVQFRLLARWPQFPGRHGYPALYLPVSLHSQVEYAVKAVENGGTAVGIRCKDGVVLALEKLITSKLLKPGANKRIATVDRNMGIVCEHRFATLNWANKQPRSPQVCYPMAAISSHEPATRQHSGGSCTRHPFLQRHLPIVWEATLKPILSTLACDRSV